MRRDSLLILGCVLALTACSDDASITDPDPIVPPAALLRDIVIPNLPSPYYHFEYDAAYRVRRASFASDARAYDVTWKGNRIEKLVNTAGSQDTLVYNYDAAGRVGTVNQVDDQGQVISIASFTYDGARLVKAERKVKLGATSSPTGRCPSRTTATGTSRTSLTIVPRSPTTRRRARRLTTSSSTTTSSTWTASPCSIRTSVIH